MPDTKTVFDEETKAAIDKTAIDLARALITFCDSYEAAKDALLKAAGMYSQAVADWPDGGQES